MGPIHKMLRTADDNAWRLGHAVVWQAISERNAHGRCTGCGREITAALHGATVTTTGDAQETACTRDLIPKKPSLQRASPEPRRDTARTRLNKPQIGIPNR